MAGVPKLPIDANGNPLSITPDRLALEETYDQTVSSSTRVTLNTKTRFIEVTALSKGIFVKFNATCSTSNFDEYVPADTTRHYVIPSGVSTADFLQQAASATLIVIEK